MVFTVTLILGYWNRSDKANVADIKDPFQQFLSDDAARFFLAHRWAIIGISIIIVLITLGSIYRSMSRKLNSLSCLNRFAAEYYSILVKLRAFTLAAKSGTHGPSHENRVLEDMSREIVLFLENSVNELSKLFEMYTGKKCHVSLKFCNGEQVKTFVRDGLSFQDRGASHSAEITKDTVWGFLCVDNKGGGFDEGATQEILQSCARMYYFVLGVLSTITPNTS